MPQTLSISLSESLPDSPAALVLYANANGEMGPTATGLWKRTGLDFSRIAKATGFSGRPGHMIDIAAPTGLSCDRLLVLGRGADEEGDNDAAWSDRGGSLFAKLDAAGVPNAAVVLDEPGLVEMLKHRARGLHQRMHDLFKPLEIWRVFMEVRRQGAAVYRAVPDRVREYFPDRFDGAPAPCIERMDGGIGPENRHALIGEHVRGGGLAHADRPGQADDLHVRSIASSRICRASKSGGVTPKKALKEGRACPINMSRPSTLRRPEDFAVFRSGVSSGR